MKIYYLCPNCDRIFEEPNNGGETPKNSEYVECPKCNVGRQMRDYTKLKLRKVPYDASFRGY